MQTYHHNNLIGITIMDEGGKGVTFTSSVPREGLRHNNHKQGSKGGTFTSSGS